MAPWLRYKEMKKSQGASVNCTSINLVTTAIICSTSFISGGLDLSIQGQISCLSKLTQFHVFYGVKLLLIGES